MSTVATAAALATLLSRFAAPPWNEDDPRRLELQSRLPANHLARQIAQAVARLDLTPLFSAYGNTGSDPFRPDVLLQVVLFEVRRKCHSPAAWHRDAQESEPVRWLLRGYQPSRSCWYAFRDRLEPFLRALNQQPLQQALAAGLTAAQRAALDGTLLAANASRHKLLNEQQLLKRLEQLSAVCAAEQPAQAEDVCGPLLHAAAGPAAAGLAAASPAVAAAGSSSAGTAAATLAEAATPAAPPPAPAEATPPALPDPSATANAAALHRPGWMAPTPTGRQRQHKRLRRAQQRMQQLQARNRAKRSSKRQAADKVVLSPSDPDSVVGCDKEKVYRPLYNVQIVADLDSPFILGYDVFAQQNDAGTLGPMLRQLRQGLGRTVPTLLSDTAYAGGADLAEAAWAGVTLYAPVPGDAARAKGNKPKQIPKQEFLWQAQEQSYLCPQGHRLVKEGTSQEKRSGTETVRLTTYRCPIEHCRACPLKERCTKGVKKGRKVTRSEHEELIEALRERMASAEAKALYRLRGQKVELVNADWKQHRQLRRFSGRGLDRVRTEVGLVVLVHNLLTLLAQEQKVQDQQPQVPVQVAVMPLEVIT